MEVKIKKLHPKAVIPKRAHDTDAGFDLVAVSKDFDKHGNVVYGFGLAFEIPQGYAGLIFPRSSNAAKEITLTNSVGVVDSGYRGEVTAKFKPLMTFKGMHYPPSAPLIYEVGDRVAQLIIMPIPDVEFIETNDLTESERGSGGYGSTGN